MQPDERDFVTPAVRRPPGTREDRAPPSSSHTLGELQAAVSSSAERRAEKTRRQAEKRRNSSQADRDGTKKADSTARAAARLGRSQADRDGTKEADSTARAAARQSEVVREREAAQERHRRAEARPPPELKIRALLARPHSASGSLITANSMRLRTLPKGAARDVARRDTLGDIHKYAGFPVEAKAACVVDYEARADVEMRVCAACGLRDPFDECGLELSLQEVSAEHWLRVGPEAHARMRALPAFELLKLDAQGGYEKVAATRELLHTLTEVDGEVYHVVPEAVDRRRSGEPIVRLCKLCKRSFNKEAKAKCAAERARAEPLAQRVRTARTAPAALESALGLLG